MEILLPIVGLLFSVWGSMWYKLGTVAKQVEEHNRKLDEIQGVLGKLLTR
jgi:hypothetical protein